MNRLLAPSLNPAGLTSTAAALWAAGVMIWHFTQHQGVIDPQVIVAAAAAIAAYFTRRVVTPVDDPRSADGKPLVVQAPPPATPAPPPATPPVPAATPAALPSGSRQSTGKTAF